MKFFKKIVGFFRKWIGENILKFHFPDAYAHYYYWKSLRKEINYRHPRDINEKLFWLARYWQDPRIVLCADKLAVRDYVKSLGLEAILNPIYEVYNSVVDISLANLPNKFVLKTNHAGGGVGVYICKDKSTFDINSARQGIAKALSTTIGLNTAEYQYQYIKPTAFAEAYIGDVNDQRLEIQFFCFNGKPRHILVRNDLGDAAKQSFAISYDMKWNRVHDRKYEDMSIDVPKPKHLNDMIAIVAKLAAPFPHVRVDMYYVDDKIILSELTFSTSGNILWNYSDSVRQRWGEELVLPEKLKTKWSKVYKSYLHK